MDTKYCICSTKGFFFNSSLRNNITFAKDENQIDLKKLKDILKFVELEQLVEKKIKRILSYRNLEKMFGGQRQKIGIARALYSDRPIIILDETTNSLDKETEQRLVSKIKILKIRRLYL